MTPNSISTELPLRPGRQYSLRGTGIWLRKGGLERRFVTGLGALVPQKPVGKPALRWEDGRRRWMALFGLLWPFLALFGPRFGRAPRERVFGGYATAEAELRAARTGPAGATTVLRLTHSQRWRAVRYPHTGRRRDGARRPSVSRSRDDVLCQRTTRCGTTPCLAEKDPGNRAFGQRPATPIAEESITNTDRNSNQRRAFNSS